MAQLAFLVLSATLVIAVSGQYGHQSGGHAESYIHFTGPVKGHAQPIHAVVKDKHGHEEHIVDYVAPPHYEFKYGVVDHHTGDIHNQQEYHDGHHVQGEYSLKEHDGNTRNVKYIADKDGFHAEVHNSQHHSHPTHHGHHY
ncbi:cuticle protein 19-like [Anabrus simplex]|uniref:cuticle protein 19-like n=1 Tax=Anabrus simplex TaxID=316456 RepID=UPI0034DD55C6